MSLKGLASAFAVVLLVIASAIGVSLLQSHFGWSNVTKSLLFFTTGTLAAVILTYKLRHLAFLNAIPIEKNKPLRLKPLHYVGLITMATGATLSVANVTGVLITFPYADKFVLLLGLLVYITTPPANGQSIFRVTRPANVPGTFKLLAISGACFLLLAIIGCFVDITLSTILPSDFGLSIGIGSGIVLAIGLVVLAEKTQKHMGTGMHRQPIKPFQRILQKSWIRIPVNLMIGFYVGVSGIALGMSYTYTHLFGKDVTRVLKVSGWHYGSSRTCAKPEIEGRPLWIGEKALCVSKDARLSMPVGTNLTVEGRESALGFNVIKFFPTNRMSVR